MGNVIDLAGHLPSDTERELRDTHRAMSEIRHVFLTPDVDRELVNKLIQHRYRCDAARAEYLINLAVGGGA